MLPNVATGKSEVYVNDKDFARWEKGEQPVRIIYHNLDVTRSFNELYSVHNEFYPPELRNLAAYRLDVLHGEPKQIEVGLKLTVFGNSYRVTEIKDSPEPDYSVAYLVPWTTWDLILD